MTPEAVAVALAALSASRHALDVAEALLRGGGVPAPGFDPLPNQPIAGKCPACGSTAKAVPKALFGPGANEKLCPTCGAGRES